MTEKNPEELTVMIPEQPEPITGIKLNNISALLSPEAYADCINSLEQLSRAQKIPPDATIG